MDVIVSILKVFWVLLKPFLIIILILTIINIIYYQIKYKNVFQVFKKRQKIDKRKRLLYLLLDKLPQYKRIVCLKNLNSNFVVIAQSGIYLIKSFYESGIIDVDLNKKYLKIKYKNYVNPLFQLEEDYKNLVSVFPNLIVKKYVVLKDDCLIKKSVNRVNIVRFSNFYYRLEKDMNDIVITKYDVDKIYNELINSKLNL